MNIILCLTCLYHPVPIFVSPRVKPFELEQLVGKSSVHCEVEDLLVMLGTYDTAWVGNSGWFTQEHWIHCLSSQRSEELMASLLV